MVTKKNNKKYTDFRDELKDRVKPGTIPSDLVDKENKNPEIVNEEKPVEPIEVKEQEELKNPVVVNTSAGKRQNILPEETKISEPSKNPAEEKPAEKKEVIDDWRKTEKNVSIEIVKEQINKKVAGLVTKEQFADFSNQALAEFEKDRKWPWMKLANFIINCINVVLTLLLIIGAIIAWKKVSHFLN